MVGKVYHVSVEAEIDDQKLRENITQWRHLLEEYQVSHDSNLDAEYVGGGTVKDAFWRTMLGNLVMQEVPTRVVKDRQMIYFDRYLDQGTHSQLTPSLHGLVPNHTFFITKDGYMGIGSPDMHEGDQICIFGGGRVPFVARALDSQHLKQSDVVHRRYHLICDAYVHGIMRGEAVALEDKKLEMTELV